MNSHTFQALQCDDILQQVAQYAKTEAGKTAIQTLQPSRNKKQVERWLEEVSEAVHILNIRASVPIHSLFDVSNMMQQAKKGMYIRVDQLQTLGAFLDHCSKLKRFMKDKLHVAPTIATYAFSIEDVSDLEEEIRRCIRHGQVDPEATKELAKVTKQIHTLQSKRKDRIYELAKSKKYAYALQEAVVAEKNGRYVLPIKASFRNKVKGSVMDASASGATVFIEPEEITEMQEDLAMQRLMEENEREKILFYLTDLVMQKEQVIHVAMEVMQQYDVIFAKAHYSKLHDAIPAIINEQFDIHVIGGRHPLLGNDAVPLTLHLSSEDFALVITGPNTGGKTVTLKTIGLLTFMTQVGLHIPAEEGTKLHLYQQIFVDIGDGQSITENLSTFSSRLRHIITILQEASDQSLVLLDELGSGTDPAEGMGLATAILDQLYQKGCTILATTHYSEMKDFAERREGIRNGAMEFDIETLRPTYRLVLDSTGESQAFQIALKLGMHPEIIEKAHQFSYQETKSYVTNENELQKPTLAKQVAANAYARNKAAKKQRKVEDNIPYYAMGDNVQVVATKETGIVYKGPDAMGNLVVQVKGEKRILNHKRIQLHIKASELYPEDYDFDIIFKSKEYRKSKKQIDRKHVEGLTVEDED
ncbi:endonuclease MutS2 [Pontibacillus litoralis]|uniref:DNA mismatch repair protein n=1 Tax=Pontibacillus litoralis JSM 072002 TaxID=1385512 RepID=A0A0A5G2G1_9BACI|nr:DNA mismatch repair protein [Pontibacillus litoralis]KGX86229.1 DNA mismatch repair protein [Pontibacillus litoralis JSM 072002]